MSDMAETQPKEQEHQAPPPKKPPLPPGKGSAGIWAALAAAAVCLAALLWLAASRQSQPPVGGIASSASGSVQQEDTQPPHFLGVQDLTVAMGGTVSYRDGVSALDDVDGPVPFQVDAEAVDLSTPGTYPVVYSARDQAGNLAQASAAVTVIETLTVDQDIEEPEEDEPTQGSYGLPLDQITQEEVDALCDQILGRITTAGMSQREKAKAIFDYVNQHIRYTGTSDKSSWIIGAYVGFTRGRGDCYNYFACSKALLTRAGIANVDLQRVGGTSRHYWQLVNTGDGWYHFDACPHPNGCPLYSFMITETQVRAYTEQASAFRANYYVYDYASCPVRAVGMPEPEENPDGSQQPENPDGSQQPENPDGSQQPENPDGSQQPENPDGSQQPENPDGSQQPENPDGSQPPENPEGTQPPENPDGSQQPENPEGTQPPENPEGTQSPENPEGSQQPENPDGSQQPENPDGSQPPENPDGSQQPENPEGTQPPENPEGTQPPENPEGVQPPTQEGEQTIAA